MYASCGDVFHARRLFLAEGNPMKSRAFALAFASFLATPGLAQNAPANGASPKMTPKLAEMLMMGEMGPDSVGNGSMRMGSMDMGGHHDMGKMPGMSGMGGTNQESMGAMGMSGHMGGMSLHMAWSHTRPETDADRKRAEQIAETLKKSLAKYQDYHVAEEAGYKLFHPEFKQRMVHFTRNWYAIKAAFTSIHPSRRRCFIARSPMEGTN